MSEASQPAIVPPTPQPAGRESPPGPGQAGDDREQLSRTPNPIGMDGIEFI